MIYRSPLFLKLIRDLWRRIGTLLALTLVLAVGVSSYISMAGVYRDLDSARANYYKKYNLADFTLDLKRAPEIIVSQLENSPNVIRLRSRIKTDAMVDLSSFGKNSKPIPSAVLSLPAKNTEIINNVRLYKGRWFSDNYANEVLLDEQFAETKHLAPGDRITVRMPDEVYHPLIVGTVFSPEFVMMLPPGGTLAPDPSGFAVMYMPRKILQQRSNLNGAFNQLLGMTKDRSPIALKNTMTLLSDKLDNYGVQLQTAQQDQISVKVLHDELYNVDRITTILPTMFLLVAALVLNVMMNRLVVQQRSAIGILKAIGYSNFTLLRHYLGYGITIGLFGGLLGILFGFVLQHLSLVAYKQYFAIPNMRFHIYPYTLFVGMTISIISSILGSLMGILKVVKLSPAESMRPPVPEKGVHVFFERYKTFWKKLSFQSKMVMRAIFRNRFRSLVTIAASILATALAFSSLEFLDAISKMISFSFDKIQHQDFTLSLRDPLGKKIMQSAETLPYVKKTESQLFVPVELQNQPYQKRLEISGLPQNRALYTPVDKKGNAIAIDRSGLVINQTLANILHVKKNDTILLRPLIGDRRPAKVNIKKIIKTYLGISSYADQSWLSHLLGNSWAANRILFKLTKYADINNINKFIRAVSQFGPMINLTSVSDEKALMIKTMNQFLTFFVLLMIGFSGIIAIGSVINTAMISLNERERDAASLRVIGFTNYQIAKIFFGESVILNGIGIFIGLFVGIWFVYYMSYAFSTEVFRMPMVIRIPRLLQTMLIMWVFVVFSQIIIYRIITKMDFLSLINVRE